jgi:transcriptional regulator of met regulon
MTEDRLLRRVRNAAERREFNTRHLHQLICEAFVAGHSGSKIAEAAGLSKPRVFQIRDGK